jgi:hypothetical protein
MDLEISPRPSGAERAAIVAALGRLGAGSRPLSQGGAWWRAGLREILSGDEVADEAFESDQATALPRSSPGANRA